MINQITPLCNPETFFLDIPLYQEVAVPEDGDEAATEIANFSGPLDAYCEGCGMHSIFTRPKDDESPHKSYWRTSYRRRFSLQCSRDGRHEIFFVIQATVQPRMIQKIGQFPSLATLSMYDVKKYSAVLDSGVFRELTKAIGLAAHGVGIGSFVYLRRIFEGLVEQAHQVAKADAGWDEKSFATSRMADKIGMLAAFLPAFLVENKAMYGILSKGIHELTEADCLTAFPVVKVGIEIILDAKIEKAAAQKKLDTARIAIQKLASTTC